MKRTKYQSIFGLAIAALLVAACAKERPLKPVISDNHRVAKTQLAGEYLFLKSVSSVNNPGELVPLGAVGIYLEGNRLVQFELTQNRLNIRASRVVASDGSRPAEVNENGELEVGKVLASFPVTHVDVLRKQNPDGKDTHEEEVTETRRVWNERDYVKIDFTDDSQDYFNGDKVKYVVPPPQIDFDPERGAINFSVLKELRDGSQVKVHYSFLKFDAGSRKYEQREYNKYLQTRFGFFKTTTYEFDEHGRLTEDNKKDFIDRWDIDNKVVYYLSKDYPEHLKPATREVFASWNKAWKEATGKEVLELRENSGQEPGDLRYNMIYFDTSEGGNRLLGYGPSVTNPRTGEIIKADVFLYGGTLKQSVYSTRKWAAAFENRPAQPAPQPPLPLLLGGEANGEASAALFDLGSLLGDKLRDLGSDVREAASLVNVSGIGRMRAVDESILEAFGKVDASGRRQFRTAEIFEEARGLVLGKTPAVEQHREEFEGSPLNQNTILLDTNTLANIAEGVLAEELSDEELEVRIFMPLLAHEMGHNFGLRHNFMGSADHKHFGEGTRSSTVMDYAFALHEPVGPGAYDVAALKFAYGPQDPQSLGALIAQNFYFCTDHEVFSSQNVLCGQHDAGTNLLEVADNMRKRYNVNYELFNKRDDRAFFYNDFGSYLGRVATYIIPMRLLYDNANAIVKYDREFRRAANGSPQARQALAKMWALLRHRIEADATSQNAFPFNVGGTLVVLDADKIQTAVDEAEAARQKAIELLTEVVEGTPDQDGFAKPEHDTADLVHNELVTKGVLFDKILGMMMLGARTGDPITGEATTMWEDSDAALADILRRVMSNTTDGNLAFFDTNLRYIAVDLLASELGLPGRLSAESIELIHLEPLNGSAAETALLGKVDEARKAMQDFFFDSEAAQIAYIRLLLDRLEVQVALQNPDVEEAEKEALEEKLAELNETITAREAEQEKLNEENAEKFAKMREQRRELNVATVRVGSETFKTPLNMAEIEAGLDLDTATGALLVDNNNLIEDRLIGIRRVLEGPLAMELQKAVAALAASPEDLGKLRSVQVLDSIRSDMESQSQLFRRYIQMEKQFLAALYKLYKPN